MKSDDSAAIKKRLGELALRYTKIPPGLKKRPDYNNPSEWQLVNKKVGTSWRILLGLGILYDGMPFTKATEILGEPERYDKLVKWTLPSLNRAQPMLVGEIIQGTESETINFTNEYKWLR